MIIPVILSGGAGTRLWPVSREGYPKPFMKLADGDSLLKKTYRRALAVQQSMGCSDNVLLTVTNRDYYFMSKDELISADPGNLSSGLFLLEPVGRNTAPAIALAAHNIVSRYGDDALMLVFAADHLIDDQEQLNAAVAEAAQLARLGSLVTFGVGPTRPETGFGYIEAGKQILGGRQVKKFIEKPSFESAQSYINNDDFFWNSGMFCFKAGRLLEETEKHAPDVYEASRKCWKAIQTLANLADQVLEIPAPVFSDVPNISIDYAVMERSKDVVVVPSNFGWSDVGSWKAVKDLAVPDAAQNRAAGEAIFIDSHNTFVQSNDRLVASVGVENLIIIDTPDALLVVHSDKTQEVKKVVEQLRSISHDAFKVHRTVTRPWGTYTVLEEGPRFKIKRIEVKPGASLSLQMHHHRSEHWIVVNGMAKVVNGESEHFVRANESTYIPAGHKHRLENPGILDLVMIEVQSGEYLGEDDIVRLKDNYGRV